MQLFALWIYMCNENDGNDGWLKQVWGWTNIHSAEIKRENTFFDMEKSDE